MHSTRSPHLSNKNFALTFYVSAIRLPQAVSDLSKFQSLCEEVMDLEHLRESGGKQVRVRPSFHEELERLGLELERTRNDMLGVLRDVEKESKVEYRDFSLEALVQV